MIINHSQDQMSHSGSMRISSRQQDCRRHEASPPSLCEWVALHSNRLAVLRQWETPHAFLVVHGVALPMLRDQGKTRDMWRATHIREQLPSHRLGRVSAIPVLCPLHFKSRLL